MRAGQLTDMAARASGLESDAAFDEINQGLTDVGVQLHPPMSYQYEAAQAAEEMQPIAKPARKPRAKAGTAKPAKAAAAKAAAPKTTMKIAKAAPKKKAPANPRKPTVERG
jgi:sec-independent protein translocase protein TatB